MEMHKRKNDRPRPSFGCAVIAWRRKASLASTRALIT
jgi:hypothetical protein